MLTPLFLGFPEGNQIFCALQPIRCTSGHGRGRAKCTLNLDEVVGEIIQRHKVKVANYPIRKLIDTHPPYP